MRATSRSAGAMPVAPSRTPAARRMPPPQSSLPLLFRHVVALLGPDVDLPRAGDLLIGIREHLLPLGDPPRRPRNREEHREHVDREADRLIDQPRIEIDVRVEL